MKLRNKKTGEIVERVDISIRKVGVVFNNDETYDTLAELNKEWEDAPEEPKEYWYIDINGEIMSDNVEDDTVKVMREIGDYFETEEEAELAVKKLKAWKRLKDKNFHFLKYSALGCGEIEFSLDFEDIEDEGEISGLQHDLDLLFGGEK